jgi:hypothetical protein
MTLTDSPASSTSIPVAAKGRGDPYARTVYFGLISAIAIVVLAALPAHPLLIWGVTFGSWALLSVSLDVGIVQRSIGLYVGITAALLHLNIANLPPRAQVYGLIATAVCLVPFVVVPIRELDGFPFLHIFCLVQAVYLYVGFLLGRADLAGIDAFTTHMREIGLATYATFMAAVVATGLLFCQRRGSRQGPRLIDRLNKMPASPKVMSRALILFAFGFTVPRVFEALKVADRLGTIPDFISSLRIAAYAVIVLIWISGKLSTTQKVLVVVLGITDMLIGLSTGGVYNGTPLAFSVLTVLVATERRILGAALIGAVFLALSLNSAKADYRVEARQGVVHGNPVARGAHLVNLAKENVLRTDTRTFSTSASRFSYADLLGYVVEVVPSKYPYWNKRSYTLLPLAFMPRVINPWKPEFTVANEFGRTYGLIATTDFASATNIPLAVEAYVNFGRYGMLAVGGLVGLLLAVAGRRWKRDKLSQLIVASVCATGLVAGIESGVTTWVVIVPLALVLGPVTRWIFAGKDLVASAEGSEGLPQAPSIA